MLKLLYNVTYVVAVANAIHVRGGVVGRQVLGVVAVAAAAAAVAVDAVRC